MIPERKNMFLVCVTVGLVFLASKYRNNVLRSVKHLYENIKIQDTRKEKKSKQAKQEKHITDQNNDNNDDKEKIHLVLDKIIVADSPEKCDCAVQLIRCNLSKGVLGFGCEWVKEGPVSLLQLSTYTGIVVLFRIGKIGFIPKKLKELLASKYILKVGVSSYEDGQKIAKDYDCVFNGALDLRTLALSLHLPYRKSLAAMSLEYLDLDIDKLIDVRCSDWNADTLSDKQVQYATCDVLTSLSIYRNILKREKAKYSLWERLVIYLCNMLNKDVNVRVHGLPAGVVDTRFNSQKSPSAEKTLSVAADDALLKKKTLIIDKNNNAERKSQIPTRIKPLYHNCYLQAPDGDILCTCDRKKAEWYITKKLGEVVDTEPFTVRLNFEPSGRAQGEVGLYYTQAKVNMCVVCGEKEQFIRKNVVPREYRKYFPLVMKAHQSHDVLLLCPKCHEISSNNDLQLRKKLADICDAPLIGPMAQSREKYLNHYRKLHSAIKALKKRLLPQQRRDELERYILDYTGQQKITTELLNALNEQVTNALVQQSVPSYKQQPHGLKVVQYFQNREGGLVELERLWREHFLDSMQPKHLPSFWSVYHNRERLIIRLEQNRIEPEDAKVAGLTK